MIIALYILLALALVGAGWFIRPYVDPFIHRAESEADALRKAAQAEAGKVEQAVKHLRGMKAPPL